jgi:hypothetical protein
MNSLSLYHILQDFSQHLPLSCKTRRVLRLFTLGVLATSSCRLGTVAAALTGRAQTGSQYRRLQRFLANPRVEMAAVQAHWTRQILATLQLPQVQLLVDETKLSRHLNVMVVGVCVEGGCIPLAWRCYSPSSYPPEGQVGLITGLLQRVIPHCPGERPWVLADRGIGTSPALIRAVEGLPARVFFRVQGTVRFRDAQGTETALQQRAVQGQRWQAYGEVFKKHGWLRLHAGTLWKTGYAQPWCLVSSEAAELADYGLRFQQEVSFRDLKSDGFGWQRSHVWLPAHAERLLLVLTLAYALVHLLGSTLPRPPTGQGSRLSLFRRGLDAIQRLTQTTIFPLVPHPPPRFMTTVVQ